MPLLDDLRHEAVEEGHDERVDVRAIDVGVGHDDNLVVAQFVDVGLAVAFAVNAEADADALDDVHHRLSLEHAVPLYLFDVQDFSAKRQDGLEVAVASLLGRATSGVTLNEEYLAGLRVFLRAVGKFAGQSSACHRILALHALTGFAGGDAGGSGKHHLVAYHLGLLGVLLQVVAQGFAYGLLNGTLYFVVAELGLGLSLELGLSHLDADDGGETLAEVLGRNLNLGLLYLFGYLGVAVGVFL